MVDRFTLMFDTTHLSSPYTILPPVAILIISVVVALVMGNIPSKKRLRDSSLEQQEQQQKQQQDDPNRWVQDYDERRKRVYYWNPELQEVCWKMPPRDTRRLASRSKPNMGWLLPSGSEWQVAYDRTNQRPYFYNPRTQEARWELDNRHRNEERILPASAPLPPPRRIIVEYNGQRGLVQVPALTSSLSTVRHQLSSQLDEDMLPPKSAQQLDDWIFQVQPHQVWISEVQEQDVQLFEALLEQNDPLIVKIHVKEKLAGSQNANENRFEDADKCFGGDEDASRNGWEKLDSSGSGTTDAPAAVAAAALNDASPIVAAKRPTTNPEVNGDAPATAVTTANVTDDALMHDTSPSNSANPPNPSNVKAPPRKPNMATLDSTATSRRPTPTVKPVQHVAQPSQGNGDPPMTVARTALPTASRPRPPPPPATIRKPPTPPTRRSTRSTIGSTGSNHSVTAAAEANQPLAHCTDTEKLGWTPL